jgi:hypothetical protein
MTDQSDIVEDFLKGLLARWVATATRLWPRRLRGLPEHH